MEDGRMPALEEMDERKARRFLTELFSHLGLEEECEIRQEDNAMEMPQSGERIRGRENTRAFQEAFPNPPSIQLRRVQVGDGLGAVEGVNDYGADSYLTSCSSSS